MGKTHSELSSYVRIAHATMPKPGNDMRVAGRSLIEQCFANLDAQEDVADFPPKLLVLMATVSFQPFDQLLAGIYEVLDERKRKDESRPEVHLIGGSVAAVIDGDEIHTEGVQLVCIASRLIDAKIGIAGNVLDEGQSSSSVSSMCEKLQLTALDSNENGNRFLFCFLPGYRKTNNKTSYRAAEIEAEIRTVIRWRIPMFGGVTGDDFHREECWQFADRKVHNEDAVVALVECDVRFGIAMSHGLKGTGKYVFARELTPDGQGVKLFERQDADRIVTLTPAELLHEYGHDNLAVLLGGINPDSERDRLVVCPHLNRDGSISLNRPVPQNWPLEIVRCNQETLRCTVADAAQHAKDRGLIADFHLAATFVFPSIARYQAALNANTAPNASLQEYGNQHPEVPLIGALVFGEIGLSRQGRAQLRNWYVSALVLSDEIGPRSFKRLANEALAVAAQTMMKADSKSEVIQAALSAIHSAGLPGAMFSSVFEYEHENRKPFVISAITAIGDGWRRIVPLTNRSNAEGDILFTLARRAQERPGLEWDIITDARTNASNDMYAVVIGRIISYYVSAQTDSMKRVISLFQIGLGDMSNQESLPDYIETFLTALSGLIATALSQLIYREEAELSDFIDRAVADSLTKTTVVDAAQTFVNRIASGSPLNECMMHVRLATADREYLDLVAGIGEYYELVKTTSRVRVRLIPDNEQSPTVLALHGKATWWVNQTTTDKRSRKFKEQLGESFPRLQEALSLEQSYVNLPIRPNELTEAIGVIHFASKSPWFFTESLYRSMRTLGPRLYQVLSYVAEFECVNRRTAELEFLRATTPPLQEQELGVALREHAKQIAIAAKAEVVSFFLWEPDREAFVLRGQHGWMQDALGKAFYSHCEGMTGTIANNSYPVHIRDVFVWRIEHRQRSGKYEAEMFGSSLEPDANFEVIAIPFRFNGPLGILTLHNRISSQHQGTRFATTDMELIRKVADDIAAFVFAMRARQESERQARQESNARKLTDSFLLPPATKEERLRRTCFHVCAYHEIEGCVIYLVDEPQSQLIREAGYGVEFESVPEHIAFDSALGRVFRDGTSVVCREFMMPEIGELAQKFKAAVPSREIRSLLAVPLEDSLVGGRKGVLLAMNIRHTNKSEIPWFTKSDVAELERVSRDVTRAIHDSEAAESKLKNAQELHVHERRMAHNAVVLATLTHDLRNKIGAIQSEIRMITDQSTDSQTKERSQRAEVVCEEIAKRVAIGLEAVGSTQLPMFQQLNLSTILKSALGRCDYKSNKQRVRVEFDCDPRIAVHGAEILLIEAFANLIDNSLNALSDNPDGQLRIEMRHEITNGLVLVSIVDTGRGIPESELPVFEENFNTIRNGERRASGVSLARYVFRQHGGAMKIQSGTGIGAEVTVSLPCSVEVSTNLE